MFRVDVSTSEGLFKKLFEEEVLSGENAFYCNTCQQKASKAIKTLIISKLSDILIFTPNRFYYDLKLQRRIKKCNEIRYSQSISVPQFAVEGDLKEEEKFGELAYDLYAIVIHSVSNWRSE